MSKWFSKCVISLYDPHFKVYSTPVLETNTNVLADNFWKVQNLNIPKNPKITAALNSRWSVIRGFSKKAERENEVKGMLFVYLGWKGGRWKFPLRPLINQRDQHVVEERRSDSNENECGLCNFGSLYIADFLGQGKVYPQNNTVKALLKTFLSLLLGLSDLQNTLKWNCWNDLPHNVQCDEKILRLRYYIAKEQLWSNVNYLLIVQTVAIASRDL